MKRLSVQKYFVGASLFVSLFVIQAGAAHAATTAPLLPSGEGANLAWTPSTGTVHFTTVDESPCNGATDYVSTNTVGGRDSYQVSVTSVPTGATITGIAVTPCASRNGTGSGSSVLNVFYRLNGATSSDAGAYSLAANTTPALLATTSYSGLSTVKNGSTTLEVGAVYTSGTKGIRLSNVATVITYITPPAAPSAINLTATSSFSAVQVNWTDNSSDETGFTVERSTDNVNFTVIGTTSTNVASYLNTGLSFGTYYYRVKATNTAGSSSYAPTVSIALFPPAPNAPTALSAVATSSFTAVLLNWVDNSSNETNFTIERSTDNVTFSFVASTSANVTSYFNTGLAANTYYYRVKAVNAGGSSAYATTSIALFPPAPNAPSALSAVATSSLTAAALSWTDNSTNETGFVVERSTDNVTFAAVATTSVNVRTYTDAGLATGIYYYRVKAVNAGGSSAYATTSQSVVLTVPIAPSAVNPVVLVASTTVVQVNWTDNSSNETRFNIERSLDDVTYGLIGTASANVTQYYDFSIAPSTLYYYRVSATNVLGTSTPSASASVLVP